MKLVKRDPAYVRNLEFFRHLETVYEAPRDTILYLVTFFDNDYHYLRYKIGITQKSVQTRFSTVHYDQHNMTIVELYEMQGQYDCISQIENQVKHRMRAYRDVDAHNPTETFSKNPLVVLQALIKEHNETR